MICDIIRRMNNDSKMRLTPPEPNIGEAAGEFTGFTDENDIFGHAEFGGRMANAICDLRTPLVFALTSGWGAGKSVFAKQLAGELCKKWAQAKDGREAKNAPVIYFDAFANDYQDNPFLVLAGEAMVALEKCGAKTKDLKEKAVAAGKAMVSASINALVHLATSGAVSAEKIAASTKTALTKQLENTVENRVALENFRIALKNAAEKIGGGQPLVFIVDELDRCRPDFALELLEKIKHLFSVPNVCFLVVTNLEQFKAVVQRTYGYSEEEARVYLDKFFHHTFRLPLSHTDQHSFPHQNKIFNGGKYLFHLWNVMRFPEIPPWRMTYMQSIVLYHQISLRDIEKMLACAVLVKSEFRFSQGGDGIFQIAATFHFLRKINPNFYGKILRGAADWADWPENFHESPMSSVLCLTKWDASDEEKAPFMDLLIDNDAGNVAGRRKLLARIAGRVEQFSE